MVNPEMVLVECPRCSAGNMIPEMPGVALRVKCHRCHVVTTRPADPQVYEGEFVTLLVHPTLAVTGQRPKLVPV